MIKVKVVTIKKPGEIELIEQEIPEAKKGEALLKIRYCGICGSDVSTYTGGQPFASYPRIPGHEFSAEIVEIEKNNLGLEKGMVVTGNPYFNCGKCYPCKNGRVNCCEKNETMGVQRDGAFSEYITFPIDRIINGRGLSAKILALIEPFAISSHAVKHGSIKNKDNVLIIGSGPIGIFAMLAAKMRGANVIIADRLSSRLNLAKEMGADDTINTLEENLSDKVKEITNGNGMDICIEAVGLAETFLDSIENVCYGGQIILIGNGKTITKFNHSVLLKKEISIYSSRNSFTCDFESLIMQISKQKIDINKIITHIYDLENAIEAFEKLSKNKSNMAKVLIKFL